MDDIPIEELKKKNKGIRQSVSAEAFGDFNKKATFVPPKHPKTPELRVKLEAKLSQSFMFNALNPHESQIVIDAMQQVVKKNGDAVIVEGEDGAELFMVESGTLACTKIFVSHHSI